MPAINATDTMTDLILVVNDTAESVTDHAAQLTTLDERVTVLEDAPAPSTSTPSGSVLLGHYVVSANSPSLQVLTRTANGTSGTLFQSDFNSYEIVMNCFVPVVAGEHLYLQLTYDNGDTFEITNYVRTYFFQGSDGANGSNGSYGDPGWILADTLKNTVEDGVSGSGRLYNPTDATTYTVMHGMFSFRNNNNGYYYWNRVHTVHTVADVATGFQLVFSNSNITRGSLTVYGLNK